MVFYLYKNKYDQPFFSIICMYILKNIWQESKYIFYIVDVLI